MPSRTGRRAFTGQVTPRERILDVTKRLSHREQNDALIGMPGSGKTRVGEQIALLTGREHIDLDRTLEERLGMPCADYIVERGRGRPSARQGARRCPTSPSAAAWLLSTGGGVVTRDEITRCCAKQPGRDAQPQARRARSTKGRPITARDGIRQARQAACMPRYRAWADYIIDSRDCAANTAQSPPLDALPAL